jgi:hypothetical protein
MPGRRGRHGARVIGPWRIDSYNLPLRDAHGFVGDRARAERFCALLNERRAHRQAAHGDPLGPVSSRDRDTLDAVLHHGHREAADLVQEAVEAFAGEFADVIRSLLATEPWSRTQRIAVGGGLREYDVGEVVIRRTGEMLAEPGARVSLVPIHHEPDEAGLLGCVGLFPPAALGGYDAALGVDIGGTNLRAGLVRVSRARDGTLDAPAVLAREQWRHGDGQPTRDEAVAGLVDMLRGLAAHAASEGLALAPCIGVGCPGEMRADGRILHGAQNLPGDWTASDFNLADAIEAALPSLGEAPTCVILHNDAVVQGLSEAWHMRDAARWGILTIGTGLGNARFTNTGA